MEDNKIDQVIASLSKIEAAAVGVQQETEREKADYAKSIEEKIKELQDFGMTRNVMRCLRSLLTDLENHQRACLIF